MRQVLVVCRCRELEEKALRIILLFLGFLEKSVTAWAERWTWPGQFLPVNMLVRFIRWRMELVGRRLGLCRCANCGVLVDEEEMDVCVDCGRRCCNDCLRDDYRNFSYWDGSVDIVPVCVDYCTHEQPSAWEWDDELSSMYVSDEWS